MMVSFVLSFFPRDVLDEILNLIESVSEDFPSYSCHSCTRHSVLTCFINLSSIIKIFLMVTELYSGNQNEVKIWIRAHNSKTKICRVVILVCDTSC